MRRIFCFLFLVLGALACVSTSLEAGNRSASSQEVWKELIKCLEVGKEERNREADRLGILLPSQIPSDVAPLSASTVPEAAEKHPSPKFQEWTKVEAVSEVERSSGISETTQVVSPVVATPDRSFDSTEPVAFERVSAPEIAQSSTGISDREKALAVAEALGVADDRELGDFLAYFPACESEAEAETLIVSPTSTVQDPGSVQTPVYAPELAIETEKQPPTWTEEKVFPVDPNTEPDSASDLDSTPDVEPLNEAPAESEQVLISELVTPPASQEVPIYAPKPVVDVPVKSVSEPSQVKPALKLPHREAFENLLIRLESRKEQRRHEAAKLGLQLPSEKKADTPSAVKTQEEPKSDHLNSSSTGGRLKEHLDRLVARREMREREAMKFGLELPSKRAVTVATKTPAAATTPSGFSASAASVLASGVSQPDGFANASSGDGSPGMSPPGN